MKLKAPRSVFVGGCSQFSFLECKSCMQYISSKPMCVGSDVQASFFFLLLLAPIGVYLFQYGMEIIWQTGFSLPSALT